MSNQEKKDLLEYKIITIGDSNVGKTSILRRFVYNVFDSDTSSTIGLSFSFKDVTLKNGQKVKLKLVDTAGQERYQGLTKSYYRNTDGVLIVFDYSNLESFKNIKEWIKAFETANNKKIFVTYLIGNKIDLKEEEKVVSESMIENFLKEIKYKFKRTSAKIEDNNIEIIINEMAEEIYENTLGLDKEQKKNLVLKSKKNKKQSNCMCNVKNTN